MSWEVVFYTTRRGQSPVIEFLKELTVAERAKVRNHIRLLQEFGTRLDYPHARPIKGHKPLWELRPTPVRLFYVAYTGKRFVILHGFKKKTGKTPQKEIDTAYARYRSLK